MATVTLSELNAGGEFPTAQDFSDHLDRLRNRPPDVDYQAAPNRREAQQFGYSTAVSGAQGELLEPAHTGQIETTEGGA